ncbi:pyridoxamine 5'-phosphate oxidase family protein [Salinibacterium sp. NSLL150]|uniref:pyridoxamine 5'-phosphate oxidase family protein n=1 Tax=unclassified Salinibacterium TaxID=2632331 RepID=UPI0018CE67C4|nr:MULTISPECIES: pyridoxamine 5'-phosphate oxidase family protein [unclassified Salinibacterium]MBH0023351.1 pyridoxamine 5'-phosphate oxidase family protein [Salinibacterium sp. SWN248]MBH0098330.1 pyridoxamine 5'-phosphate oxidase family protein [Salinibacterium sp. NSLL35]MBH0101085.1 pyridoxamine 5'-phosphate oxidase family protein [Salinibacterium sp. NSLL150]MBH0103844.1 pyridoxamine 5'-phosphate oxidase family protein [Salinibacterium sp. NSLL16]MBH0106605.1 pyridoxamine 5'-phosphate ox
MSSHAHATADQLGTIRSIMKSTRIAMLTSVSADGALHSHPMTVQEAEFDGDCWFLASAESDTVQQLLANPHVNLAYAGSSEWLSLAGSAEIVRDGVKKEALWDTFTDVWFDGGAEDPSVVLIHVKADSAQYWESPGKVATLVSVVAAKVTGDEPHTGSSESVTI